MKARHGTFKQLIAKRGGQPPRPLSPAAHRDSELRWDTPEQVRQNVRDHTLNEKKFEAYFHEAKNVTAAIKKCPDCASLIINCMTKYPKTFDHIVKGLTSFTELGKVLNGKNEADALMQFLLSHPDEFERLVKTEKDIQNLYIGFPKYAKFFADKTPEQITKEIKLSIAQAHTAILLLYKYNRSAAEGKLKQIPDGIIIDIARHLLNDAFTLEDAKAFAGKEARKAKAWK